MHCCCVCIVALFFSLFAFLLVCIVVQLERMAKESFPTPTLKEEKDTLTTLEALSSEELQSRLDKIMNMLSLDNNKDVSDFESLEGDQDLPPYDPLDKSTYTSRRPQFLRYRPGRKYDDEDFGEKYEGMERSQRSPCSKIKILILVAALFVFIFGISAWSSSKFYAGLNLQAFNEYADGFGLPMSEILQELELSINEYADELGIFINEDLVISGLRISENIEKFSVVIDGDEAHSLEVLKQFGTLEFENTYNFVAHSTILIDQSGTLALENPNHMEAMMLEGKKAKDCVLNVLVAQNSKNLGMLDVLVSEDSKHLGVLDVLAAEDCKHLGAVPSSASVKSLKIPLLYGVTGAFFCAAAIVLNWYKKRATYACPNTSLESVKEIQTKMQRKDSCVPSVQLLSEYSSAQVVSSFGKNKDIMWNDSSIGRNSFYIPNLEVRRKSNSASTTNQENMTKGNSASITNQENMTTGEVYMENSFYGSLTMMAKKDKDKEQQKVIPVRRSDRVCNPTKSDCSLYKSYVDKKQLKEMPVRRLDQIQNPKVSDGALYKDVDKKQQKEIPLRRSERIRNSTKSDYARRQDA